MLTNKDGGFFTRCMPPIDWDYGIPDTVYGKSLTRGDIREILFASYISEANKQQLEISDDPLGNFQFELSMEVMADIDAGTIYWHNQSARQERS